jgi:long-chain acyl-CoA synthetase
MFEKTLIASIFYGGGSIGFSRGHIELLLDEVKALKPTIFPSIPVLYNHIYDIIMNNINSNTLSKNLFDIGYNLAKYDYRFSNMLLEKTLFKSIRNELGGKVRLIISGVSTTDPKILEFMKVCFRCNVMQIYGLSETVSCISIVNHHDKNLNNVGCPSVCGEICVKRNYNLEYLYSLDNNVIEGELLYRGANLFKGYYSGSDESCGNQYQIDNIITDKVLDQDGWFHTGDFIKILNNGAICFIDRISNIIKLDNGKFISFEKIERTLETVPNIYQSFVYGENAKSTIIALLVLKDRTQIPNIEIDIIAHINTIFRNSELYDFEIPSRILILDASFTLQNGLLTPTFKLQRQQIIKKYITLINKIYY